MKRRILPLLFAAVLTAHPMGNFSVSHYTRLDVSPKAVDVTYVVDLAEIPTYQLFKEWKLDPKSPQPALDEKAAEQSRLWLKNLDFRAAGKPIEPKFLHAEIKISDGAGGLQVARIASTLHLDTTTTRLDFEDHNFPERAGWKEIVIHSNGVDILQASHPDVERSKALTEYPADPTIAPPQDLRASVEWRPVITTHVQPKITPIEQPAPPVTQASTPTPSPAAPAAPGTVVKGDFLSRMLGQKEIGMGLMLIGIAVAFGLGAIHALSPGHGKTIVAAYLVGSRGTAQHAAFLGAMVTFTHTISVFILGLATLFISKYVVPEKIIPVLGAISGLSIVAIGASLFLKRLRRLRADRHQHTHHHDHAHVHDHSHTHEHVHAHHHDHGHDHDHDHHHDHDHGPHGHSHVPEGDITLGSLIALGASGGLVPCPSALVLLLSSIALGHVGLGLILLVSFSLGLAVVLMTIGMLVLYAKHLLPDPAQTSRHPAFRLIPVLSAGVIVCLGLLMTGVSLGWVRPGALIG
jgi:ABC-type nickel/cobalt efflux system permease component RcnA